MLAASANNVSQDIEAIRVKFPNDPDGLRTALASYADNLRIRNPGQVGQTMFQEANTLSTQFINGAVASKAVNDVSQSKANITLLMQSKEDYLASLASQPNGTATPEYAKGVLDLQALSDSLVKNPAFGVSAAVAQNNMDAVHNRLQGAAAESNIDADSKGPGGVVQAMKNLHDAVMDPKSGLSPADQDRLIRQGEARIHFNQGQNAVAEAANKQDVKALDEMVKNPTTRTEVAEPLFQAAITRSMAIGDTVTTAYLQALHQTYQAHQQTKGLSPNQSATMQGVNTPDAAGGESFPSPAASGASGYGLINAPYKAPLDQKGDGGFVSPAEHYSYLISQGASKNEALMLTGAAASESSFNQNAIHDGGNGHGLYGHNDQRLNMTGKGWQQQASAALQELRSRPEGAAVNSAQSPEDLALAEMHYEQPRGFSSNSPKAGDNYTGRLNTLKYFAQMGNGVMSGAQGSPTGGAPPSANGIPFSQSQIAANPFLLSTWAASIAKDPEGSTEHARNLGESILKSEAGGIAPSADIAAEYHQIADGNPKLQQQATEILAQHNALVMSNNLINLPASQAQSYEDSVVRAAQGGSIYQARLAEHLQAFDKKAREGLRNDPDGTAVAKGWTQNPSKPIQFDNQLDLGIAMHQRQAVLDGIQAHGGDSNGSAVFPKDLEAVKSVLANGSAQQQQNFFHALSGLPEETQKATYAALGDTGRTGQIFAVAGTLAASGEANQVAAASAIQQGYAALKQNPELLPKPTETRPEIEKYLPLPNFPQESRDKIESAIGAAYAKLSNDAGDVTGKINTDRYKTAVDMVTGGIVQHGGQPIVAPWYGASQADFNAARQSLTQDDMRGSLLAGGGTLPAAMVKSEGVYKLDNAGIGSGQYRIYSGTPDNKVYVQSSNDDRPNRVFILDLGAKRAGVEAGAAALQKMNAIAIQSFQSGATANARAAGAAAAAGVARPGGAPSNWQDPLNSFNDEPN